MIIIIFQNSNSARLKKKPKPYVWGVYSINPSFMNASYVHEYKFHQQLSIQLNMSAEQKKIRKEIR